MCCAARLRSLLDLDHFCELFGRRPILTTRMCLLLFVLHTSPYAFALDVQHQQLEYICIYIYIYIYYFFGGGISDLDKLSDLRQDVGEFPKTGDHHLNPKPLQAVTCRRPKRDP